MIPFICSDSLREKFENTNKDYKFNQLLYY